MSSPEPGKRRGFSLAHGRRKGGCEASEELDDGFGEKECRWPIGSERGPRLAAGEGDLRPTTAESWLLPGRAWKSRTSISELTLADSWTKAC